MSGAFFWLFEQQRCCSTLSGSNDWRKWPARGPISRVLCHGLPRAMAIYLAGELPRRSCGLPESRNGPDQPCSHIWPCFRWGLPSQPVTRLLVRSYFKARRPAPFHPCLCPLFFVHCSLSVVRCSDALMTTDKEQRTTDKLQRTNRRYPFCCTFPVLANGGRYPPPCPLKPGLSSSRRGSPRPGSGHPAPSRVLWIISE